MMFRQSLDAEIMRLEAELAADPRAVKLQELRRVRSLYDEGQEASQANPGVTIILESKTSENSTPPSDKPGRKMSPERIQALMVTRELLKGRASPTRTADILEHLQNQGINIGGNDPQNNLSALLYHAPDFESHGKAGWTLTSQNGSAGRPT
jgi:hypothetical protein